MRNVLPWNLKLSLLTRKPGPFLLSSVKSSNTVKFGDRGGHAIDPRRRLIPITVNEL
jgi:hypothetical protein